MGNPLKLTRTGNTSVELKEMSNTDMDYITHLVLRKVALESDNSTGALNVSGVGTTIGYFSDTARVEAIGTKDATGALSTTTTTLSQNLVSVAETTVSPLELINKQPKPISSTNLDNTIISYIQSNIANTSSPSISQYYLSSINPATLYSGTWVSVTSIQDTFGGSGGTSSTSTTLWKKTNDTTPLVIRPLKLGANGTVIEMSDIDIESLTDRYRNKIVSSGIGTYTLSTSPPGTGTWVQVGQTFVDTRQQVAANTYAGTYAGTYNRAYTGSFTGGFNRSFTGAFTGLYNRSYSKIYSKAYTATYTGSFTSPVQKNYTGGFTGIYVGNYTSDIPYSRTYTRVRQGSSYLGRGTYYTRTFISNYQGYYSRTYAGSYSGTYSRIFTGLYNRQYIGGFNRNYISNYTKLYTKAYSGQYARNFTGTFSNVFNRNFTKGYTGNYTGQYVSDTVSSSKENVRTISLWLRVS